MATWDSDCSITVLVLYGTDCWYVGNVGHGLLVRVASQFLFYGNVGLGLSTQVIAIDNITPYCVAS